MNSDEVTAVLAGHVDELRRFGVERLAVFGSVARNEASPASDVDILVEFNRPAGYFEFNRLRRRLESILERRVDLATPDSLRSPMRERVLREAVDAA